MSIGYACLTLGVPHTGLRKCLIKNADENRLHDLIAQNLDALERMVEYNIRNGIRLFRISSDIIPFASSPVNRIPWDRAYGEHLAAIGQKARDGGMRLSMHPGQYTVLNSPNEQTVENAVRELEYHARFLDALGMDGTHKIVLHVGGAYGDKPAAMRWFEDRYQRLADAVKSRLIIENDDKVYTIQDVLTLGRDNRIPVVFDNLHHRANPCADKASDREWIAECAKSWMPNDGKPKIHYSQPDPGKKQGAHSLSIGIDEFLLFYEDLDQAKPDIMLEVKDKNISAVKCVLSTVENRNIGALEREWGRYKYLVLEHSQQAYQQLRQLLKQKEAHPAIEFFRTVEAALRQPIGIGSAINAAQHVWGYFKDAATVRQKVDFAKTLDAYSSGQLPLASVKRRLHALAENCGQGYLLESYYFVHAYDEFGAAEEALE